MMIIFNFLPVNPLDEKAFTSAQEPALSLLFTNFKTNSLFPKLDARRQDS